MSVSHVLNAKIPKSDEKRIKFAKLAVLVPQLYKSVKISPWVFKKNNLSNNTLVLSINCNLEPFDNFWENYSFTPSKSKNNTNGPLKF